MLKSGQRNAWKYVANVSCLPTADWKTEWHEWKSSSLTGQFRDPGFYGHLICLRNVELIQRVRPRRRTFQCFLDATFRNDYLATFSDYCNNVLPKSSWLKGPQNSWKWLTNLNYYFLLKHWFNHRFPMFFNFFFQGSTIVIDYFQCFFSFLKWYIN